MAPLEYFTFIGIVVSLISPCDNDSRKGNTDCGSNRLTVFSAPHGNSGPLLDMTRILAKHEKRVALNDIIFSSVIDVVTLSLSPIYSNKLSIIVAHSHRRISVIAFVCVG